MFINFRKLKISVQMGKRRNDEILFISWFDLNFLLRGFISAAEEKKENAQADVEQDYRIDQPGTITFTVGVKIKGKIEKPQVMIFLPKEKTLYRDVSFKRTFSEDLADPLPFTPILE